MSETEAIWNWGRFEREALATCDGWRVWLFWPQFLLEMAYLVAAPIKEWKEKVMAKDATDKCEGCDAPATTADSEGVPLCAECFDECAKDPDCHTDECECAACNPKEQP